MDSKFLNIEMHISHFISFLVDYTPKLIGAFFVLFIGLWFIKRLAKIASKAMDKKDLDVSLRTFLWGCVREYQRQGLFPALATMSL